MLFTSEHRHDDGVVEREFTLDGIPGILWTPPTTPAPLLLLGHPGDLPRMYPRLSGRARQSALHGFATTTVELPVSGDRPRLRGVEQARADLRRTLAAGGPDDEIIDRLITPLVTRAVPEWQGTLDALLTLSEISGPAGFSGGPIAIGIRLALIEPRIAAAGLFCRKLRAPCHARGGQPDPDSAARPAAVGRRRK